MQNNSIAFPACLRILVVASVMLYANPSFAWGVLGHRITGLIAEPLLTPAARHEVQSLLGDESLADAAPYMDTHRDELRERWPDSARWHYDNKEACGATLYCRDGACATQQIVRFRNVLADRHASQQQRALALRILVHLIGDIHQPLHMVDDHDHGGNDVWVRLYPGAEKRRLHEVFDTALVRDNVNHHRDYIYARELLSQSRSQINAWQRGDVDSWARESYALGVHQVYGLLPGFACGHEISNTITLPAEYVRNAHELVAIQLAKAGARIAAVLNTTLQ